MSNLNEHINNIIESTRMKIFLENTETVYNAENCKILHRYGVVDHRGIYNSCLKIQGYDKPFRGRSEILIFRNGKLLVNFKNGQNQYYSKFPGGGWDKGEEPMEAAIREAKEEVMINVKDVKFVGTYLKYADTAAKWVRDNIPEKDWWYGYYTMVYIGEYDSKFSGNIAEEDKDDMVKTAKWIDIDECYDKLESYHKKAINMYLGKNKK